MKRIISLLLAVMLVISAVPMAYAADTQDYSLGTAVKYTAANNENYTITVPAKLAPGQGGTVTLDGYWASNTVVSVTAEENVVLTNSINANDQKTLDVSFDGISEAGDNSAKQTFTAPVSVAGISNALFGTWSGHFNYTVGSSEGSGGSTGGDSGTTEPSDPDTGDDGGDVDGTIGILYGVPYTNDEGYYYIFNEDGTGKAYEEGFGELGFGTYWTEANNNLANRILDYPVKATFSEDWTSFTTEDGVVYTAQTANLITFTIDGTEYQAEEGMKWFDWIDTEYNTAGFTTTSYGGYVYNADSQKLKGSFDVFSSETIHADTQYTFGA